MDGGQRDGLAAVASVRLVHGSHAGTGAQQDDQGGQERHGQDPIPDLPQVQGGGDVVDDGVGVLRVGGGDGGGDVFVGGEWAGCGVQERLTMNKGILRRKCSKEREFKFIY